MLVLQAQKNNKNPIWIEIEHAGETIRVTACKRKTIMPGLRDTTVAMFFDGSKNFKITKTSDTLVKKSKVSDSRINTYE